MIFWQKIRGVYHTYFWGSYYKQILGSFGKKSIILRPTKLDYTKRIYIGDGVYISTNTWLAANPLTGDNNCKLIIGNGTSIGRYCHIYSTSLIEIGENVLLAEGVYISDNTHQYTNIHSPIMKQPILQLSKIKIDNGAWIGENVCIIGSSVGKNSVIGANSIVTKDIPDYCIAVGSPARIVKRFNFDTNIWQKTNEHGEFI
jgi:acetyltransferase-like isoleucine patch superfamily enzyme